MNARVLSLVAAASELVSYIEENHVYDKLADAGCGGIDSYRSEKFDELIINARKAVDDLEKELQDSP